MDSSTGPSGQVPIPPVSPTPSQGEESTRGSQGGSTVGVVLVLVGMALLASRWLPGVRVWMLWPLLIIVPGAVKCFTPGPDGWTVHRFLDGIVTIVVGLVFLGNATGYLPWDVWGQILQLWPVLLISVGLGILGSSLSQEWLQVAGKLVVLAALAYAVSMSLSGSEFVLVSNSGGVEFSRSVPSGGATSAELDLKYGVGDVRLESGSDSRLIAVKGRSPFGTPIFLARTVGSTTKIDFSLGDTERVAVYPGSVSARVEGRLSRRIPWDIGVDSGVSSLDMDLSDVKVRALTLKTGVSSNQIKLGDVIDGTGSNKVTVQTGVSSVTVLVPEDAETRIVSQSGLTGHTIGADFEKVGTGRWETAGFAAARRAGEGVWLINVKSGLGSITVDTY